MYREIELSCGDVLIIDVSGSDVSVYTEDEGVSTSFSPDVADEIAAALSEGAVEARENGKKRFLHGKRIVLTGKFDSGREKVAARVRAAGGVVATRITHGSVVVSGDIPWDGTWKTKHAARYGATVKRFVDLNRELEAVGV